MKIALIGATGQAGTPILKELVRRGHQVTAIVRNPEKVQAQANVTPKKGDVFDKDGLAALLKGHDAVISAVHFTASDPQKLIDAAKASGIADSNDGLSEPAAIRADSVRSCGVRMPATTSSPCAFTRNSP